MATQRIGIIGCGQIAQHHMRTYKDIADAEMVICCDLSEAAAQRASETYGIPNVTTDFREVLRRDDIDAVDVCLYNNLHAPVTIEALRAGKHVYCEKPMAGTYFDAAAMKAAAEETGKKLHIQLSTLYTTEVQAARELIEAGELGNIYHSRSTGFRRRGRPYVDGYATPPFVQRRHAAGGALYDMGVYHISTHLYLLGNPTVERISGKTYQEIPMDPKRQEISQYDVEELGLGFVRFAGHQTLDILEAWAINLDKFDENVILGSHAGIRLWPFGFFKNYGNIAMSANADLGAASFRWDTVEAREGRFKNSQAHWIHVLNGTVEAIPTADIALNTMLISEGIYLSNQLGREVTADEVRAQSTSSAFEI
jgi:predicted dehydrogenase